MSRRSVHVPVVTPAELRGMGVDLGTKLGIELGPDSPLKGLKPRRKPGEREHEGQVKLFAKLAEAADTERGRECYLDAILPVIHAIPNFNANIRGKKAKTIGARYKAEGQRPGMPDVHVPVPTTNPHYGHVASLYVELKAEEYPSERQRELFPKLADWGNVVVVVRNADPGALAAAACETILRYLERRGDFAELCHPKFIYIPD